MVVCSRPLLAASAGVEITCRCFLFIIQDFAGFAVLEFLPVGSHQFSVRLLPQTDGKNIDMAFVSVFMISL